MGHTTSELEYEFHLMTCDQCDRQDTYEVPRGQDFDWEDEGWLGFIHPNEADRVVTFHTKRCAIGFFRDVVGKAYARITGEAGIPRIGVHPDDEDPSANHTVDEAETVDGG